MFDVNPPKHHIQKHILNVLTYTEYARFRDLRPPKVDTNLYSYHLNSLMKSDWINKSELGYTLSKKGLVYVDRISSKKLNFRTQSKIITMLVLQNNQDEILLQKRVKQPYINTWTLPYGKTHIEDKSTLQAAKREALEKLNLNINESQLKHVGDCYIRVFSKDLVQSSTLAHIFHTKTIKNFEEENTQWISSGNLTDLNLAPAVENIINKALSNKPPILDEFNVRN